MTKTQAAFCLSVKHLFETYGIVYFWTFTFVDVHADWCYPTAWRALVTALGNRSGGLLGGLRVLEVHPGGHGLHYHALLNLRLPVDDVRRIAAPCGFGILQVKRASGPMAGFYLAKYLSKRSELYRGMHRWGRVGCFRHIPKSRVEVDSSFTRNMRKLTSGRKSSFEFASLVYTRSKVYGDIEFWPKQVVDRVMRQWSYLLSGENHLAA